MLAPIIFVSEQHYQVGIMAFQIEADHSSATLGGEGILYQHSTWRPFSFFSFPGWEAGE